MRYNILANHSTPPEPINLLRATVKFDGKYSQVISFSSRFVVAQRNRDMIPFQKFKIYSPKVPWLFDFIKTSESIDGLLESINDE